MKVIGCLTGFYLSNDIYRLSHPDCRPTNIEAEMNVDDRKRRERRSFCWIYLRCTTSSH